MAYRNLPFRNSARVLQILSVLVLFLLLEYSRAEKIKQLMIPTDVSTWGGLSVDPNKSVPAPNVTTLPNGKFSVVFPVSRESKYVCTFDGTSPNSSSRECPEQVVLKGTNVVKIVGLVSNNVVTNTRTVLLFDSTYQKLGQGRLVMNVPSIAGVVSVYQFDNVTDVVLNNRLVARYDYNIGFDFLESSGLVRDKYQMLAFSPNMGGNACNTWGVNVLSVDDHQAVNSSLIPSCGSTDIEVKAVQEGQLRVSFSGGRIPTIVFQCDPERIALLSGSNNDMKGVIASDTIYKVSDVAKANAAGEARFLDLEKNEAALSQASTSQDGENAVESVLADNHGNRKRINGAGGSPSKTPNADLEADGSRSTESILRVIQSNASMFRYVYERYAKLNPNMGGKITLKFTIAPSGDIIAISVVSSSTGSSEMDDEIKDRFRRTKFDPIEKGNVTVTYTFTLSNAKR